MNINEWATHWIWLIPFLYFLPSLIPTAQANRLSTRFATYVAMIPPVGLALATVSGIILCASPTPHMTATLILGNGELVLTHFDRLTWIIATLICFLSLIIFRYSIRYMAGDPRQGEFTQWLSFTTGSILMSVTTGNLALFAAGWSLASLGLHKLLSFYPNRPGALHAARKKYVISRLGDFLMLASIFLCLKSYGTLNFNAIIQAQSTSGSFTGTQEIIALLLVAAAMLKSAQLPFHSWLPDTLETPTPVSALMHAGIINAGGYLVIRLHSLIVPATSAMTLLIIIGATTAVMASLVMLTHASLKRKLAFSTVAQMGFMMLQCGLGAFALATLHIVAHSLYKAHGFLASGSLQEVKKSNWSIQGDSSPRLHHFLISIGCVALVSWMTGIHPHHEPGGWVLCSVFILGITQLLAGLWSSQPTTKLFGVVALLGLSFVYLLLHTGTHHLLDPLFASTAVVHLSIPMQLVIFSLFLLIALLHHASIHQQLPGLLAKVYVHARNGFYFNTIANRMIQSIWPVTSSPRRHP